RPTTIFETPSLHDALPICGTVVRGGLTVRKWALRMGGCGRAIRGRSLPMVGGRLIVSLTRSRLAVALRGRGLARRGGGLPDTSRSEEHTSELQSRFDIVCR